MDIDIHVNIHYNIHNDIFIGGSIMTAQEMLDQAIIELGNLKDGDVFIVKDLFKWHLWNNQNKSERLTLGTLFMNFVKQNPNKIEMLNKNSSGQQEYKLINGFSFKPLSQREQFASSKIMTLKLLNDGMIYVSIGTSGLDLYEMSLQSGADIEKLASILNQSLVD